MKCKLKDGPLCSPLEKYHTHSSAIYESDATKPRNETAYTQVMTSRTFALETELKAQRKVSHDEGRGEVGVLVLQDSYSFLLKFFSYDKAVEITDVDYPLEAGFTRVYTATVDITFRFPNQIMLT